MGKDCQYKIVKILLTPLFVVLFFVALGRTTADALTSQTVNFRGKIVRNDTGYEGLNVTAGSPSCVVDGAGNDTCDFRILYYTASTGGTLLFTEDFSNVEIGTYGGVFNLSLGSGSVTTTSQCLDGTCNSLVEVLSQFNDVYIELQFAPNGSTLTETFARMPLEASAYSIYSKYSDGASDAFKFSQSITSGSSGSPVAGMVYYNTTSNTLKLYNGTEWVDLADSTGTGSVWADESLSSWTTWSQFMESTGIGTLSGFSLDSTSRRVSINGNGAKSGLSVYSSFSGSTDWPLVSFKADNNSFTAPILELVQDGTGDIMRGYTGSDISFEFDNLGDLHLNSDGKLYFEQFASAPVTFSPNTGEGCMYSYGGDIYWDPSCDGNPEVLNAAAVSGSLWTDGGAFTYLTSATDDLVLGATTLADATFVFDVDASGGAFFEVDSADNSSRLFTIASNGNVGIGTDNPSAKLEIGGAASTISNTSGDITIIPANGLYVMGAFTVNKQSDLVDTDVFGTITQVTESVAGDQGVYGTSTIMNVTHTSGTLSTVEGTESSMLFLGNGGTTSSAEGFVSRANTSTGAIVSNLVMMSLYPPIGSGSVTNLKGLYIGNMNVGSTSNYSIYSEGGTMYHAGNVGIGIVDPSAKLDVASTYSTATGGEQYGNRVQTFYATADTNHKQGLRLNTYASNTSGTMSSLIGLLSLVTGSGSGGTTTDASGLWVRVDANSGHTITNSYGLNVQNGAVSGTIGTQYGVYVNNLTSGSTDNFAIYTAGTTKSYFGGSVGIGTTSPQANLDIVSSTAWATLRLKGSAGVPWTIATAWNNTNSDLLFQVNGSEKVRMDGNGRVGIGNTAPSYPLDVTGNIRSTGTIYANANGAAYFCGGDDACLYDINLANTVGIYGVTNSAIGSLKLGSGGGVISGYSGRIGIGNTAPGYTLDVSGTLRATGASYLNGAISDSDVGTIRDDNGGWVRTYNSTGWYNQTYGGGWFMGDSTWIRNYGSKRLLLEAGSTTSPTLLIQTQESAIQLNSTSAFPGITLSVNGVTPNWNIRWNASTSAQYSLLFNYNGATKMHFDGNTGIGYSKGGWTTFSPYLSYNYIDSSKTKEDYELGDVVKLDTSKRWTVNQTNSVADDQLYGVIVRPEGFVSIPKELKNEITDENPASNFDIVPVAHLGEASTKVILKSGQSIASGSYVTSSTIYGFAELATGTGNVLGKTLESTSGWSINACPAVSSVDSIVWPDEDGSNPLKPCFTLPNGDIVGKLMIFVNVGWYDANTNTLTDQVKTLTDNFNTIEEAFLNLDLGNQSSSALIKDDGWYRVAQSSLNDSASAIFKLGAKNLTSNQTVEFNAIVSGSDQRIDVKNNVYSNDDVFTNVRYITEGSIKYLEVYVDVTSEDTVSLGIYDNSGWKMTNWLPSTYTGDTEVFALSGVSFNIDKTLVVSNDLMKVTGDLISSNQSDLGSGSGRWNDVYASGSIRLGNSGSEGSIRYNIEKHQLEFSNDGDIWVALGDLKSQNTLSPEYSGAVLYADGTNNAGTMTSDVDDVNDKYLNYYQWSSDKDTLQDYDILVRITLPDNFVGWNEDGLTLDYVTENAASTENNKVDLYIYDQDTNITADGQSVDNISILAGQWQRTVIKGSDIDQCNEAGETCVLRIVMSARDNYFVRVGDIVLNYNRSL